MDELHSPYAGVTPVANPAAGGDPVTLVEGRTFTLSARSGDMAADLPQGLFVLDTRVLSHWELLVNGHRVEPLAVQLDSPYEATFACRGHAAPGRADADLVVLRHRSIGWGMRERVVISNHGLAPVEVAVELSCDVDFADLFEVKERRDQPDRERRIDVLDDELIYHHLHGGMERATRIWVPDAETVAPGRATWRASLAPGRDWEACIEVSTLVDGAPIDPRFTCAPGTADSIPAERLERWRATVPTITSEPAALGQVVHRSGEDLGALRIFDPDQPGLPVIAAGAPWFMTVFGRDSLLTGWMSLLADHTLAEGVLETLARLQGADVDPHTEEEPGKILHEMRFTSASGPGLSRGDVYYGSIDATPLFVMLLGELRRWDPRAEIVDRLLPHADRALDWITEFGDRDGDGYVEYERQSDRGLANQGWKDSWDGVRHREGPLARPPIALCEVQGYVYAAYVARAHLAIEAGDHATAERFAERARTLQKRFNDDFWLDEAGTFALGLDADKRPIAAIASNVGHCLWTGIIDPERAPSVVERLLEPSMFSGWGIRTLGTSMPAFNPVSYHNGSVWPHDNALIAAGLARYGFVEESHRVIEAQLDVATALGGRLPELFAGFARDQIRVPAAYPTSCSPQAWAAAAPLLWLRSILRLDPSAPSRQLWISPQLPPRLRRLAVDGIKIGGQTLAIRVDGDDLEVEGLEGYEVVRSPRPTVSAFLEAS